ncbi:MAG TPA: TorF family putative porin [Pseudomonadales bacterium]|nr:TorF family putative porin [Pseudomonadales bacterium]
MNKRLVTLLGSSVLTFAAATASAADSPISGNVSLITDYKWRGISQTTNGPAVQGGLDFADKSGLYAGIWGSNVTFGGSLESDWYFGYNGTVNSDLGYSVGYIYYYYPKQASLDGPGGPDDSFQEINGSVTFKGLTAGVSYSNNFFGETGKATYFNLGYDFSLPNDFGLSLHYGNQNFNDNASVGLPNYSDYSIGLTKSYGGLDFGLTWVDTNLSKAECGSDICKSTVTFSVGKSL